MKNVFITGGSRGIGRAMVEAFSSLGYNVAFTYKESYEAAKNIAERLGALAIKADSEIENDVIKAVNLAKNTMGSIDILINNAAVSSFGILTDITLDEWNRVMNTTMTGAFLYSKAVLPDMINRKWGRIINITSMWGVVGSSCEVHYSAAKAALIGFTKALAKEVGPSGITVNAIAPGFFVTKQNQALLYNADGTPTPRTDKILRATPMGRFGKPEELLGTLRWLCDNSASGFVTGIVVPVDGGFSAYSGV
jgi:3-oxoacyl-[acyl-carrier protein] reductase